MTPRPVGRKTRRANDVVSSQRPCRAGFEPRRGGGINLGVDPSMILESWLDQRLSRGGSRRWRVFMRLRSRY